MITFSSARRPRRFALLCVLITPLLLGLPGCGGRSDRLPDLAAIEDVGRMKHSFYAYLRPIVAEQNARIREQRARVEALQAALDAEGELGWLQRRSLRSLAEEYEIEEPDADPAAVLETLRRRVDIVPADLALAQAAKESGWGRSRFAVEANNLFGQWCYEPGCGVVPANRPAGAMHEVEAFDSVAEAIRRYMNNLNTHPRYAPLRQQRQALRAEDAPITGAALASGLLGYSERGEAYIQELRAMMRRNEELLSDVSRA